MLASPNARWSEAPVSRPIHILLAEDDDNDVRITRRAIKKGGLDATIGVARDGQEALDMLFRRPPYEGVERPDLVLLDINLPKINGVEVLRTVKRDPVLQAIPVLMLTTSACQEDVTTAYALGANTYICKPIRFARFVEVIRDVSVYWSRVARLPGRVDGAGFSAPPPAVPPSA